MTLDEKKVLRHHTCDDADKANDRAALVKNPLVIGIFFNTCQYRILGTRHTIDACKCALTISKRRTNKMNIVWLTLLPTVAAYSVGPRRFYRPPRVDSFSSSQNQNVDEAFARLKEDLKDLSSEEAVNKQKKWVDRAFGLFSELNQDTASENEKAYNEEQLRKTRKFVNNFMDFATELNREIVNDDASNLNGNTIETPRSNVVEQEDGSVEILLELPGVLVDDVNLEVQDDLENKKTLIVSGERKTLGGQGTRPFFKEFALPDRADIDNISATLQDGLMKVVVHRKAEPEKATRMIKVNTY